MKNVLHLLVFLFCTVLFAQKQIEKKVGEFNELKVYDLIEVELIKADDNKIVISGLNTGAVLVNNLNGVLKIKMVLKEIFDGQNTKVTLYYNEIDVIDANEGSRIYAAEEIKQFELDLRAQEGGKIELTANNTYTNINAVTGGKITLTGTATNQKVNIATGGFYYGEKMISETTEVKINIGGEAHVNATKLVDAYTTAGGTVFIHGVPEKVNHTKKLGGSIEIMEEE